MLTKTAAEGVVMEVFVARCNVHRFIRMLADATDPKEIGTLEMLLMNEQQILEEALRRKWLIHEAGAVAQGAGLSDRLAAC
jgi:hypothetical protein